MQGERLAGYTDSQFADALWGIYEDLIENKTPVPAPTAILLGGQPGAGKTTLHRIIEQREPNTIFIVGDDFREHHPNFAALNAKYEDSVPFTAPFAGKMTEALIDRLSDERYNLAIEGTLRTTEVPEKTNALLKNKGYTTELHVMAVSAATSWNGTLERYKRMKETGMTPRATEKGHHDMVVAALPENLGKLYEGGRFSRICLFTREKECVYDSLKTPEVNPRELIKTILEG
ncbi:MAG: zeta toxin family protein [Oscillospiraceae bacterium]|jgi:UDP-N-acetylglucosamine kinase|nr:zeta toxin family protein [Oscillospiraceae bacterium]